MSRSRHSRRGRGSSCGGAPHTARRAARPRAARPLTVVAALIVHCFHAAIGSSSCEERLTVGRGARRFPDWELAESWEGPRFLGVLQSRPCHRKTAAGTAAIVMMGLLAAIRVHTQGPANASVSRRTRSSTSAPIPAARPTARHLRVQDADWIDHAQRLGPRCETTSPSYIEIDPDRGLLFAVNETEEFEGKPTGLSASSIDRKTGKLTPINRQPAEGKVSSYLASTRAAAT